MECNKDEAARAKLIAERKLTEKDFAGAKKFALKAQTLYPGLEDLPQMLTTLDVYISAENKVNGEVDWYGILGVNPSADDETVKKQYRKLALMLHPDKNKSVGADGAFKLLSEAWSFLSDKSKRLAYNQRRSSRGVQQKVPTNSGGPAASHMNGFQNFSNRATSNARTQNNAARVRPTSVPPSHPRTDTFWTICHRCKMHYEYLRLYLNHTLLCPTCHEAFLASETAPPFNFSKPSSSQSHQRYQNPGHHATNGGPSGPAKHAPTPQNSEPKGSVSFNHANFQKTPFSGTAGLNSSSLAAKVVQQANERLKREREEAQAAGGWERLLKKRRGSDDGTGYGGKMASQMATGNGGSGAGSLFGLRKDGPETDRVYGFSSFNSRSNRTRELTLLEIRNMLMAKARAEISKKINEWSSETVRKVADTKKEKLQVKEKGNSSVKSDNAERNGNGVSSGSKGSDQAKKSISSSADDTEKEAITPVTINVPDPDFHDFDKDRTESSFEESQVWAAYDDDDGMPRFYAMIHKVISSNPFKIRISWLNSKTSSEFGTIDWVGSGFSKTCGVLRVGRYETNNSLNSFSHKVKWEKGPRGTVCIFPKKGDVWALYRNWSPDWNEHTPDEVIHKYDMVVVLEDYDENQGVSVAPLVKVTGFRTVFRPETDPEKVLRIPKEEMFRFSHQVPNYLLTGLEADNAPKGCQELDPAATPMELLQVITEANEASVEQNNGKAGKGILQSAPTESQNEIMTDSTSETKEEHFVKKVDETKEGETIDTPK